MRARSARGPGPVMRSLVAAALMVPATVLAEPCDVLGEVGTDGTGAPDRYRVGGTYLAVAIGEIAPRDRLVVVLQSGPPDDVALHLRTEGGIWTLVYRGPRAAFEGTDPLLEACRADPRCTHVVLSVNGADERYESIDSSARVELCLGPAAASILAATESGWSIPVPAGWSTRLDDLSSGGSGVLFSPDEQVVVGITTFAHPPDADLDMLVRSIRLILFPGAERTAEGPVRMAGMSGREERYGVTIDGAGFVGLARYLSRPPDRLHAVWVLVPARAEAARLPEAELILQGFELLGAGAVPLSLGLLVVGTDPDTGTRPETARETIPAAAEAIHVAAGLSGTRRAGSVTLTVTRLADGQDILHRSFAIDEEAAPSPVVLTATLPRPPEGWVPGVHGVSVAVGDRILGRRLFMVERSQ